MDRSNFGRLCATGAGVLVVGALTITAAYAATAISTQASAGGMLGTAITDTATLTGLSRGAGGTVTFKIYGPDDATCGGTVLNLDDAPVNIVINGTDPTTATATSAAFTPGAPGVYRFTATYSDSSGATVATEECNGVNESVTITKPPAVPGGPYCIPGRPNFNGNGNEDDTYGNVGHGNQGNCNVGSGNEGDLNGGNGSASNPPEDE